MSSVSSLNPSDSKLFHDYLLPSLSTLPNDPEELVRVEYALGVVKLALVAHGLLIKLQQEANLKASRQAQATIPTNNNNTGTQMMTADPPAANAAQGENAGIVAVQDERSQGAAAGLGGPANIPSPLPPLELLRYDHDLACARQSMEAVIKDLLIGSKHPSSDHQGEP